MLRLPLTVLVLTAATLAQDLPIVPGASGDVPTKATLAITMRKDGSLFAGKERLDYAGLRARLKALATKHPDKALKFGDKHATLAQLYVRMHPSLSYEALTRVMWLCTERDILLYRIFLGVQAKKGGPEFAVPVFLPIDSSKRETAEWMVGVEFKYTAPPTDQKVLRARLAKIQPPKNKHKKAKRMPAALLKPEYRTPVQSIAMFLVEARLAGFDEFGFGGLGEVDYPEWKQGDAKKDFMLLVKNRRKVPDSLPGISVSAPFENSLLEEEEIEEEIEEEEEEEEEVVEEEEEVDAGGKAGGKFGGKKGVGNRNQPLKGRNVPAKVASDLALAWLAKHQDENGRFDADGFMKHDKKGQKTDGKGRAQYDVGVTGLALLAFLGGGNTMRSGPYKDNVKRAVKWLVGQQAANGLFGTNASHDFIYGHAIATYAMCEAYGLSDYKTLKKYAQKGIDYLEAHRNPYSVWRYQPRDNDNDISVTSWCVMAYKAAGDFKLKVNQQALRFARGFLDQLTDTTQGRVGYTKRGEQSSRMVGDHATRFPVTKGETLTAAGLFMRFMMGQDPKTVPVMKTAAELLLESRPKWKDDGSIDFYYWYYGTYAMYQMGGRQWEKWRSAFLPALLKNQRKDKSFAGSWDTRSVWSEAGGRIYTTAMGALMLQAFYRYARLAKAK